MSNNEYLINGECNVGISPLDRGFSYGDGVFRTMRIQSGIPNNWHLHYQKLVADCASIGIVCPSADWLMDDIQKLFYEDAATQKNSVAKIIITRGEGERGYATPSITSPMRVVMKFGMPKYSPQYYSHGVELSLCKTRLGHQPHLAGIKHLNRLDNVIARMEWRDEHLFDGLLLDTQDHVIECTMSNIFIRNGQHLITPALANCGVSGITRLQILALAKPLDLLITEDQIKLQQLVEAEEVIICNSLYGVFQVIKMGEKIWQSQSLAIRLRNILKYEETNSI